MKNHYKIALLFIFLGVSIPITISMFKKSAEKNEISESVESLPEFELLTLKKQPYSKQNLTPGLSTIFIYFNSKCEFCQNEVQSINENLNLFKEVQFVFVSKEPILLIERFSEEYDLKNKPNIIFLQDNNDVFTSLFDTTSIPYTLVYGKDRKLIKKHKGQLNADGILRVLVQNE